MASESTDRYVTVAGTDHLTADFSANSIGGRIEGGYRFAVPTGFDASDFGITPYGAVQVQAFRTPSYSETAVSGSSIFALSYDARTTTTTRTELGGWVDKSFALDRGNRLSFFGRAAWAHDWYSEPSVRRGIPVFAGVEFHANRRRASSRFRLVDGRIGIVMRNGWSMMAKFDTELSKRLAYLHRHCTAALYVVKLGQIMRS